MIWTRSEHRRSEAVAARNYALHHMSAGSSARRFRSVVVAVLLLVGCTQTSEPSEPSAPAEPSEQSSPEIVTLTDPDQLRFNPSGEFIFPSLWHAGDDLTEPLGEWYLYYAPHDPPGGIAMMYADDLDGPWTEYAGNPIIANQWDGHYQVSHVSSPDAVWNDGESRLFVYFHGENSTTRYAVSADGVTFEYGGVAVERSGGNPDVHESSYARVIANTSTTYVMLFMDREEGGRRIRVADSDDGRRWSVRDEPLIEPGGPEGSDVSSANLWMDGDTPYVVYHGADGRIWARSTDTGVVDVGPPRVLFETTQRAAAPEIVRDGELTRLFFEYGGRTSAVIATTVLETD